MPVALFQALLDILWKGRYETTKKPMDKDRKVGNAAVWESLVANRRLKVFILCVTEVNCF